MARFGSSPLAFPDFKGATRRLILINLAAFFALLVANFASPSAARVAGWLVLDPSAFMQGALWQPLTYSFIHTGIVATLFELLSLWFLAGFLESFHESGWVTSLYAVSVLGTAAAALVLYLVSKTLAPTLLANVNPLFGCFGGIFGLLVAIGVLYGDTQFLLLFVIGIKARYMAIIYALVAIAMLFGQERMYAFAQLGGALAGWAFVRMAPRRGMNFMFSESLYGLRNRYYRWKRRRAARKFEVYMRSQGRTVKFDGQGRIIDEDPDDKKRWN
jgi:membrane associated rhomboid family serine protease